MTIEIKRDSGHLTSAESLSVGDTFLDSDGSYMLVAETTGIPPKRFFVELSSGDAYMQVADDEVRLVNLTLTEK